MKNKFKYIIAGLLLIMSSSCTDWLDPKPLDRMVLDDYWKTNKDVEAVVLACYRAMAEDGFMERIILGGELRSDNVIVDKERLRSTDAQCDINDMTIKATNELLPWQNFYFVINLCNTVLEYAPQVVDIDPDYSMGFLRAHEAEVRAIRALAYFYLVRIYRDVPYIDFSYADDTQEFNLPKTDGNKILELQIEELLLAERFAMKAWGRERASGTQQGRVTKNMVRALLADIYLWLGRYDECVEACNRILPDILEENEILNPELATGAELRLLSNNLDPSNSFYRIFYMGNSMESIFELQFSSTVENKKIPELYGRSQNNGRLAASKCLTDYFKENEQKNINDLRAFSFRERPDGSAQPFKYIGMDFSKTPSGSFYAYNLNLPFRANWIFYRVADVYLMKAEALVELGNLPEALELVNLTYMRSNPGGIKLSALNYTSLENMQDLVLLERQREFLFEGKRWFDLVRLAHKEDKVNGINNHPKMLDLVARKYQYNGEVIKSKMRNTNALYLPIAEKELISNTALVQNPYYDDLSTIR